MRKKRLRDKKLTDSPSKKGGKEEKNLESSRREEGPWQLRVALGEAKV
jgi:hypothetical protein